MTTWQCPPDEVGLPLHPPLSSDQKRPCTDHLALPGLPWKHPMSSYKQMIVQYTNSCRHGCQWASLTWRIWCCGASVIGLDCGSWYAFSVRILSKSILYHRAYLMNQTT